MDPRNHFVNLFCHFMHPPTRSLNFVRQALNQKDLATATDRVNTAKQKYPDRSDVNQLYAQIHAMHEDWAKVRDGIERIAANPNSSFGQTIAAVRLYWKLGEQDNAIDLFQLLGNQSRGWNAGLTWNSIGHIYLHRSEPEKALTAFAEGLCRGGPANWVPVIKVLPECSVESVTQCRNSIRLRPAEDTNSYRFHKLLRLLEQRLMEAGLCDQETMIKSIRTAADLSFKAKNPKLNTNDIDPPLKPAFLIIGAMKCGTTTLSQLIAQHPRCLPSMDKEVQFFQFSHLSDQWYFQHFPRIRDSVGYVAGDASPEYYCFDIVDRVKSMLPNAKLIFIQRDPALRAVSHIRHNARFGMRDFGPQQSIAGIDELEQEIASAPDQAEQIILDVTFGKRKQNNFVALGCYELLLRRWKRAFGSGQLLTIKLEDLSRSPQATMDPVFRFIGLEPIQVKPVELNVGNYNDFDPKTQELLDRLQRFYSRVTELTAAP